MERKFNSDSSNRRLERERWTRRKHSGLLGGIRTERTVSSMILRIHDKHDDGVSISEQYTSEVQVGCNIDFFFQLFQSISPSYLPLLERLLSEVRTVVPTLS